MALAASCSLRVQLLPLTRLALGHYPRLSPLPTLSAFSFRSASSFPPLALATNPTFTSTNNHNKMGELRSFSTVNFYSGSELNRLSWLRDDDAFLNRAITSPEAQFVLLNKSMPMVYDGGENDSRLATLSWDQVAPALKWTKQTGVFGAKANGFVLPDSSEQEEQKRLDKVTAGLVPDGIVLVLLGIKEADQTTALPGREPHGTPYFALSLSYIPPGVEEGQERVAPLRKQLEAQEDKY